MIASLSIAFRVASIYDFLINNPFKYSLSGKLSATG